MSFAALAWIRAAHVVGFTLWAGTLLAVYHALFVHARAEESGRGPLQSLERRLAMAMDAGALVALVAGIALLYGTGASWSLLRQPWMHIKLAFVVLGLLGFHVAARVKVRRFRDGAIEGPAPWPFIVLHGLIVAIILLAVLQRPTVP